MKKKILMGAVLAGAGIGLYSCGNSSTAGSGTVALYATDAPLDGASRVEVGIKEIRIEHTGTGQSCVVFAPDQPYRVDLTDLQGTMQLLDLTNCPAGEYNRLVVTLEQSPVDVLYDNNGDGTPEAYTCSLTDYDPERHQNKPRPLPNRTVCDSSAGECYLYVTGAVNILANQTTDVALDFSVKDSEIEIDTSVNPPSCTVAFKVYPLHAKEVEDHMKKEGKEHEIKGTIVENTLDTTANTFDLSMGSMTFTVNYDDSIGQGVDDILQLALDYGQSVEVECSSLDLNNATCTANEIEVKVKGTATDVDQSNMIVSVDIDGDGTNDIDVKVNEIEDVEPGKTVEVEVTGYDSSQNLYLGEEAECAKH